MPGQSLHTEALVLAKQPPADTFQTHSVFSAEHGSLLVLVRLSKKANTLALDLFDEVTLMLESSNQGKTWFAKEVTVLQRNTNLGKNYETLQNASDLARLLSRNTVSEESRSRVYALAKEAFAALADTDRPDIVFLKSLYRFVRDEGYPVREQWFPSLPRSDREALAEVLNRPATGQKAEHAFIAKMRGRLEDYVRADTEILLS